jgi:ribosomal-protein-alanine N-acetyltransferase
MSAVRESVPIRFRPMSEPDLREILEIECQSYDFPWSAGIFRDCLRVGYPCWILEGNWRIDAYGVMTVAIGEAHLLNLCVRPEARRLGYGRAMLHQLLKIANWHRAENVFLEVRPTNEAAQALYAGEGFCEVGYRRAYYPAHEGREDALILAKSLLL